MVSDSKVYFRNLMASWGGHTAHLIVAFFLSPFVVHTLGDVRYGIWSLILSVVGYMGLADIGLRRSISKQLNQYLAHNDHNRAAQVVSTSLALLILAGLAITASAFAVGRFFHLIFSDVSATYMAEVRIVLLLAGVELTLSLVGSVFRRAAEAFNRFDLVNIIGVGRLLLRTVGVVGVLLISPTLIGLVIASLIATGIEVIFLAFLAHHVWPQLRVSLSLCSKQRARELRDFGIPVFIDNISKRIISYTDLLIVGMFLGVQLVTIYSIGLMVVTYAWGFLSQIVTVLTPDIYKKTAIGDHAAAHHLYVRSTNSTAFVSIPILVGILFFAEEFVKLWMGPEYLMAARVMQILAFSMFVTACAYPAGAIILGYGRARLAAFISTSEAVLNLGLSIFLVKFLHMGIVGIAVGTLIPAIIFEGVLLPSLACRMLGLPYGRFFVLAAFRWTSAAMLFSGICMIAKLLPTSTWATFTLTVTVLGALYLPIGLYSLFDKETRDALRLILLKRSRPSLAQAHIENIHPSS